MKPKLASDYLGLRLENPILASSSPLTSNLPSLCSLEDAGVAGVVLPSLFEEQVEFEALETQRLYEFGDANSPEVSGYFPELSEYNQGPDAYLDLIRRAKESLDIPVMASLNGHSPGGWARYASLMEEAGADAIELNVYFVATDTEATSSQVEKRYVDLVDQVRGSISVPLAIKIGPYFSSVANMASRLDYSGADGLVLFNRYLQPDLDLETMQVVPHLHLSHPEEVLQTFRWIAVLRGRVELSLCATGGAHDYLDIVKLALAGADAVAVASSFLRKGPGYASTMLQRLREWMSEHEYESIEQMKGSFSQENCPDPAVFERGNYMRALTSFTPKWS